MTDKEMLELAAKAAGIEFLQGRNVTGLHPYANMNAAPFWNPLEDDGDAFRLAVELGTRYLIFLEIGRNGASVEFDGHAAEAIERGYATTEVTRRAIVRAAAEIGRNMK